MNETQGADMGEVRVRDWWGGGWDGSLKNIHARLLGRLRQIQYGVEYGSSTFSFNFERCFRDCSCKFWSKWKRFRGSSSPRYHEYI